MKNYLLLLSVTILTLTANAQTVPSYVPTSGLMAWYPFNGNAGDSSGTGNHGTVAGATPAPDRFGVPNKAYYFNGTSDYISIAPDSSLALTDEMTLLAWIKSGDYHAGSAQIFWRGDALSGYDPYMLFITGSAVKFRRSVGTGTTFHELGIPSSIIDTSQFHLVVATYSISDDTAKLYYDGVLYASAYTPGAISYSTAGFWNMIGAVDHGTWQFYKGLIDDVGAWGRRLSDCEISKLYYATDNLILSGPVNVSTTSGSTAIFSITDTGGIATYQWQADTGTGFFNIVSGGIYSGATTDSLTIYPVSPSMDSIRYRCIRTGTVCMDVSDTALLLIPSTTLVSCTAYTGGLKIVPNPNKGQFSFVGSLDPYYTGSVSVILTDIFGKHIITSSLNVVNGNIMDSLDLTGMLSAGTYFVKLQSGMDNVVLRLVIR